MILCKLGIHKYKLLRISKIKEWDNSCLKFFIKKQVMLQCECGELKIATEELDWTDEELEKKYNSISK